MADKIMIVGKNAVAELIGGLGSVANWDQLAVGTSGTAATNSQTALVSELVDSGLAKATSTVSTTTANILQLQHTWTATAPKTLQEVGVFNSNTATDGTMLARSDFADIALVTDDQIQITYKITVS